MTGSLPASDALETLRWLLGLSLATLLARPLALRLLVGEGGGWIAGRLLGWLIVGWVPWLLAAFHILPFGAGAMAGIVVLALSALRSGLGPRDLRGWIGAELAFLALFWLGLAARLIHPDLTGLEKFTDMGFLSAAMRTDWMPPQDAWFAGYPINYYYVGQAMVAAWGNLSAVPPDHAYQLGMATIFALTAQGAYLLVARLVAPWGPRLSAVLGGTGAVLTIYGGNGHSLLYKLFRGWMPTTKPEFYYPDSTRFIGFDPDMPDKGFTEFTSYGFAAGDLHAHLVATPLFLLGVVLILSILRRGLEGQMAAPREAIALGWMLGLAMMINSWDLAILGLVTLVAVAVLLSRRADGGMPPALGRLDSYAAAAVIALSAAAATAAPFLASFQPFAQGVEPVMGHTPLWQLGVVWFHVLPGLVLIPALAIAGTPPRALLPVAVIALSGLFLVALPETIYLRDIYGADFARANTMFKLTFRAQTLLVAAALAVLAPALARGRAWTAAAIAALAPLVGTLAYLPHVYAPPATIRSLDGLAFLGEERALLEAARHLPLGPGEALVEASGEAFTDSARVSALTGQPAVIGWVGHEWLWRNAAAPATERAADVDRFYTTADRAERCRSIRRYGIRYVIVGKIERARYPELDDVGLRTLGSEVYGGPGGLILRIADAACAE